MGAQVEEWGDEREFQGLALTGGGFRGLFSAQALASIEEVTGKPIGTHFDLICGTSIGGIVAIAAAFEVPMAKVVEVFASRGGSIFPDDRRPPAGKLSSKVDLLMHVGKPRYSTAPLREAIEELIPRNTLLGEAIHPVAIPAVNLTQGSPQVFKTRHKSEWQRDSKLAVSDIALATAAAPTFFELAEIGGDRYADGGLFANAPDQIALHEAEHYFGVSSNLVRLLSVGTTTKSYSVAHSAGRDFGIGNWMKDARLFSVMISAQQQFVGQLMAHRLGDRYVRIDREPSHEQAEELGLDIATEGARSTLISLAKKAVTDIVNTKLTPFLQHSPHLKIIRN
jgi:patatin-like phospholipase/acyl hydrolase